LKKVGSNWDTTAGRDIIWRSRATDSAKLLAQIIADPKTKDTDRPRYFRAFDFIPASSQKQEALAQLLRIAVN
jgi:hypothetical protein